MSNENIGKPMNSHGNQRNEQKQIRISDFIYAFRKHHILIVICTIIGLIVGIALSVVSYMRGEMAKRYAITSSIAVTSQNENGLFTSSSNNPGERDVYLAEEMVDSVIYVMKSDKMLNAAIEHLNLIGVSTKDVYDNLDMKQYNETQIIEITLYWRSAQEGVEILNAIAAVSQDILIDTLKIGNVSIVNEPKSKYLIGGNINANVWGYLAILGLCVGAGLSILDLLLRPTLLDPSDMENYFSLEILGEIPDRKAYFSKKRKALHYDEDDNPDFSVIDNYSSIAHIVRQKIRKKEASCIYITSASQNEGKTTVTANLAVHLSEIGMKVLVIDFDTKNPMLGGHFLDKVEYQHSINALYRGDILSDDAITHLTGKLDILPAVLERKPLPIDEALLGLVSNFARKYDIILLDTAPVGQVADTMSLNRLADTAIVVVRFDGTQLEIIRDSLLRLEKSDMDLMGCVINRVKYLNGNRNHYGYYYGNAYRSGNRKTGKSEQQQEWEEWERDHSSFKEKNLSEHNEEDVIEKLEELKEESKKSDEIKPEVQKNEEDEKGKKKKSDKEKKK